MTNQEHPITPPPELVEQWADMLSSRSDHAVFSLAAQWGANQELDECCMWIRKEKSVLMAEQLDIARRPERPSLKEQALEQLGCIQTDLNKFGMGICTDTIRRALEQLND